MSKRLLAIASALLAASLSFSSHSVLADGHSTPEASDENLCFDKGANSYVPCVEDFVYVAPWTGAYAGVHAGLASVSWDANIEFDDYDYEYKVTEYVEEEYQQHYYVYERVCRKHYYHYRGKRYSCIVCKKERVRKSRTRTRTVAVHRYYTDSVSRDGQHFSNFTGSGLVIGGQVGYNHQFESNLVLGLEGDFSFGAGLDASVGGSQFVDTNGYEDFTDTTAIDAQVDWLASIRGRAGYAIGDVMPFVTAGVGFAGYDVSVSVDRAYDAGDSGSIFEASESGVAVGPVLGGGVEYLLTPNMMLRGEALYYIFNEEVLNVSGDGEVNGGVSSATVELNNVVVGRIGLNIKF